MKSLITKTSILTVLTLFALSLPMKAISQYDPEKGEKSLTVVKDQLIQTLSQALDIPEGDMIVLVSQLEDIKILTIDAAEKELDLHLSQEALMALGMEEDLTSSRMEDWMFNSDYYSEEYDNCCIKDWMLEELIPAEPEQQIENWMFGELTKK